MNLEQRLNAFVQLGNIFSAFGTNSPWPGYESGLSEQEYESFNNTIQLAGASNGWFTDENVRFALNSISQMLEKQNLEEWTSAYPQSSQSRNVGVIMAGNIPLVGFHDLLCVLLSGHVAIIKPSSSDAVLTKAVVQMIKIIDPELAENIKVVDQKLTGYDAIIATGSDNSSRYFETYFGHVPNIIRKNRTSLGVISGNESKEELTLLGEDIFRYFGLGCRNVSKILLPENFEMDDFFQAIYPFHEVINHHKYANNYDYNKAVHLMNRDKLLENGFLLLKEDKNLFSPLAMLFYDRYNSDNEVDSYISDNKDSIQCVVGKNWIPFGEAQSPKLSDYADGVDTMLFLADLN